MKNLKRIIVGNIILIGAVLVGDATDVNAQGGCGGHGGTHSGHSRKAATQSEDAVRPTVVDGVQIVKISVSGSGYSPSRITVRKDMPVRLVFEQFSGSACASQVQMPALRVPHVNLPQGKETPVEFTPTKSGSYVFTCGMEMLAGTLIVE